MPDYVDLVVGRTLVQLSFSFFSNVIRMSLGPAVVQPENEFSN